jgi:type I pantothenate kinase
LRQTAFRDPRSFFRKYADLTEAEALEIAEKLWDSINLPNLRENILPTRQRASLILTKGASHRIQDVALRRL